MQTMTAKPSFSVLTLFVERVKVKSFFFTDRQVLARHSRLVCIVINLLEKNTERSLESVAEFTKRPLLSITAADLGHEPVEVEKNLLRFFQHATSWDAIVLLDEADVFLERRSSNDLKRNSVVSSKFINPGKKQDAQDTDELCPM